MRRVRLTVLVSLAFALASPLAPREVTGHPHVWAEYAVIVRIGPAGPEAVEVQWLFDPLFSGFLLQSYDRNRDGALSADEVRALEKDQRAQLKAVHYFVEVRVNDQPVPVSEVGEFQVQPGGQFSYRFLVPLPPRAVQGTIEIAVQDPTIMISFAPRSQSPVRAEAPANYAVECSLAKASSTNRRFAVGADDVVRCAYRQR
jgi:ABC-type uncharacterized transport system substrate-binding protein